MNDMTDPVHSGYEPDSRLPGTGKFHKPRKSGRRCGLVPNIVIGVIFILDSLGIVASRAILSYWSLIPLAIGISMLIRGGRDGLVGGFVLTAVGGIFLARRLGLTDLGMRELWPAILILVGVGVLTNSLLARRARGGVNFDGASSEDVLNDSAFFGGVEKKVQSENFRGGEVTAIFGGVAVNLRRARIVPGQSAVINANAMFGGVELFVPEDWVVVNEGMAILGGFADSRRFVETEEPSMSGQPRKLLIVRGMALMGGVEVKN
jgi:predicted membrane protein